MLRFLAVLLILPRFIFPQTPAPGPGTIHEQISCRHSSSETYALYLPKDFSPDSTWPILVSFDPGGRVMLPMNLLRDAAESGGYILICPRGVKNGPLQPALLSLAAVWGDVVGRWPIDGRRVYAVGFSGGARMASVFPQVTGQPLAGILACGAGLNQGVSPEQLSDTMYVGITGYADFNYSEMVRLEQTLAPRPRPSVFFFIDQAHQWPQADLCRRAIELFTVQAMKDDHLPRETTFLTEIFQREFTALGERSLQGEAYFAARQAVGILKLFTDLHNPADLEALRQGQKAWLGSKSFKVFQKEEAARLRRESDTLGKVAWAFSQIRQGPQPDLNPLRLIAGLGLHLWVKTADGSRKIYETSLARRILSAVADAARDETLIHLGQQQVNRAEWTARIRCEASQGSPGLSAALYDHGCILARLGRKKEALKALREALSAGFSDRRLLMEDPDWDSLRSSEDFQALLKGLPQ
jgi:hypothetical protein